LAQRTDNGDIFGLRNEHYPERVQWRRMDKKPPILPYRSPHGHSDRPLQTPVRNQINAAIYSAWVMLKWIGKFLNELFGRTGRF
jgi:hypothetical protein